MALYPALEGHRRMRHTVKLILYRVTPLFFGLWTFSFCPGFLDLWEKWNFVIHTINQGLVIPNTKQTRMKLVRHCCVSTTTFYLFTHHQVKTTFSILVRIFFHQNETNGKNMNRLGKYFEELPGWSHVILKWFNTPIANNIMGEEEGKSEARGGAMRKTFKVFHKTHDKQQSGMGH